jgi:tripartite-type tricarboxylate transporter receptor subunit TctC
MTSFTKIPRRTALAVSALALAAAALSTHSAFAQSTWPTKPVRIVVPFAAGGTTDILARAVAPELSKAFGQQFIVDNRPGAGGNLGAEIVARAPNDGYTLLMGTVGTHGINRALYPKLPFDPIKDFAPITLVAAVPNVMEMNAEKAKALNINSVADFIKYAKANPGKLNMGSYGSGTLSHLAQEYLISLTGINLVHVPFGGSSADVTALARGDIQTAIEAMGTLKPQIDAGRIRVLSTISGERFPLYPDVPGMKESGFPQYDLNSYQGFGVKTGTPRAMINKLNEAANKAVQDRAVRDHFLKVGLVLKGGTPEEYTAIIKNEIDAYAKVIKERNLVIE